MSRLNLPNSLRLFCAQNTQSGSSDAVTHLMAGWNRDQTGSSESNLGTHQCSVWMLCVSAGAHKRAHVVHVPTYTLTNLQVTFCSLTLYSYTLTPDLVTQLHGYSLTSLCVYLLIGYTRTFAMSCTCLPSQVLTHSYSPAYLLTLPLTCVATYTITHSDPPHVMTHLHMSRPRPSGAPAAKTPR